MNTTVPYFGETEYHSPFNTKKDKKGFCSHYNSKEKHFWTTRIFPCKKNILCHYNIGIIDKQLFNRLS